MQLTHGLECSLVRLFRHLSAAMRIRYFKLKAWVTLTRALSVSVVSDRLFGLIGVLMLILMFPFAALAMGHQKILGFDIKFLMYGALAFMLLYFFFLENSQKFSKFLSFQ